MPAETIRLAQALDLPAIVEIYNDAIPDRLATADTVPVTVAQRTEWFQGFNANSRPLWVLESQGSVVAWIALRSFYGRAAYHRTVEVAVYVAASQHRKGFAGRLLAHALDASPALGVSTLLAFVFAHNEPSIALFVRHGFAGWGRLPRVAELDGIERDLLILGRRL